jgi:4-hydroxy-3-polyprenylbenzoate decarboxylase
MAYNSLQQFVQVLEKTGELKRISYPVRAELEITEIANRVMKSSGPASLFARMPDVNQHPST